MSATTQRLDEIIDDEHIVVCTGAGGVGKTTTSAAIALRAAERGRRVAVCTIDPAKRLAQAMGLEQLDNAPRLVTQTPNGGELHALMLDMKRTFDEMVLELASPERAERILQNSFYQHVSSTLSGTQEYMAMQKLYELHEEGRWELIVIDTPPTRSALDFLDAPRRLTDFLEGRLFKLILWPYMKAGRAGFKIFNVSTRAVMKQLTRITGSELFSDLAEFFQQFEGMYESFKHRAQRVRELLGARRTGFIIVTAPTEPSLREARYFAERLTKERMPLGGIVVNRLHTAPAAKGLEDPESLAARAEPGPLRDSLRAFAAWRSVSLREERLLAGTLGSLGDVPVWRVPDLADDVHDVKSLRAVGELLSGGSPA
jgi:anion-transporting  ArsA/GET3 family ATPase